MIDAKPLPPDEKERLSALRNLNLLDTLPEERFDRITRMAKRLFNVPIAMINFIDADRMWPKSQQGAQVTDVPRAVSLCAYTILQDEPLIVSDTTADSPFVDNPLVTGEPHLRFYAGQPVRTADGYKIGSVCLMDFQPRVMSDADVALLRDFAGMVEDELIVSETMSIQKELTKKIEQTERSEQSLRKSEARYRALVENSPDVIAVIDRNYTIQFLNSSALRSGFTLEQLIGQNALTLVPPAVLAGAKAAFEKAFAGDPFASYEYVTDSGLHFETRLTPIREGDQIVGLTLVLTDITARHTAEETQRRLARIIEATTDSVSMADLTGKLTYLNAAGRKAAGVALDADLSKLDISNFSPPASLAYIRDVGIPAAIRDGVWSGESIFYGVDGQELPGSQVIIAHKGPDGSLLGLSTIVRDTSEQKRAADERERLLRTLESTVQELQIANRIAAENSRLKSEFLSTMSHELRTPLNAIEGFTSIMLSNMGIDLSPRAKNMLERVSANSKRLLHLINDFLDLSRIESGRMEIANTGFSPIELTNRWRSAVSVLAEAKALDFVIHVDRALPDVLYGDEEALSKIVLNLLSNAFKFTRQGRVTLSLIRQENLWTIEVRDTGIGIPHHAREYIFEEFRQVDNSSKREFGGSGLGLSIVHKLVRLMNGTISLESEMGVGSTFTVTLPLSEKISEKATIAPAV